MNNNEVEKNLDDCALELNQVNALISSLVITSNAVPYLTKYSLIKACGTIERAAKKIVADFCKKRSKKQVKRYLTRKVREKALSIKWASICDLLKDFDEDWPNSIKVHINRRQDSTQLKHSLTSLSDLRNEFAHGGNPTASIGDVLIYFHNARIVIEILDNVVS